MTDSIPEELKQVEPLIREAKLEEALKIVLNYEKKASLTDQERLSALILRGRIKSYRSGHQAYEIGVIAYNKSKDLNDPRKMIEALLLKSFLFLGDRDALSGFVSEAENLLHSFIDDSNLDYKRLRATIDYIKGWIRFVKGDFDKAEELAFKSLELREELGYKLDITRTFSLLVSILDSRGDLDMALDKALKLLTLQKELGFQNEIASGLVAVGTVYTLKGDYENALQYFNQGLSNEELGTESRLGINLMLGSIYREKGELEKSIEKFNSVIKLSEETKNNRFLAHGKMYIATDFRLKGEYSKAKDYLKQGLALSEEIKNLMVLKWSLFWLAIIYIDENSLDQAQIYVDRLKELDDQTSGNLFTHIHYFAKANLEKKKGNLSNRELAKNLLKRIIGDKMSYIVIHIRALVLLSELLLEDLNKTNDSKVLNEVNTLISQSSTIAEKENSHLWSTQIKLLQAKLALIQINIPEAKQLLTQAQRVAEINNLTLLAQKISSEHDRLLEQLEMWEHFKKVNAPMADRLELAGIDGDIDQVQGKHAVDPPELVEEEPILLLIMDNSGSTYFNHPFMANWDYSDFFSSFMSAFNTFSSEIFSKSIDRIRIGENTILITPAEPFLACYVIKGQSYPALQKLSRFTEAIKENSEIWQALKKSVKTSEMLELDKPPILKSVINEIFN